MRRRRTHQHQTVEMQMTPMIDMVFLLLVFFMVSAKPVQPERDIPMGLPGQVAQEEAIDMPDETRIVIESSGQIVLNERRIDSTVGSALPELRALLIRYSQSAKNARTEALVTLAPHDEVPHQRLVDVLNACAEAGIVSVSLAAANDE